MKILLLIRSLDYGGAERQLVMLAKGLKERNVDVRAAVFYGGGPLQAELAEAGVMVHDLGKRGRWDVVPFFLKLRRVVRSERPDVLYTFLDTANVLGLVIKSVSPGLRVAWGIRSSVVDWSQYDWLGRATYRATKSLARFVDIILVNSNAGYAQLAKDGFPTSRVVMVPNGIDTTRFAPDVGARRSLRETWGVEPCDTVVGIVGRVDPMKAHETFVRAAAESSSALPGLRFVCVGGGDAHRRRLLVDLAERLGVSGRLTWAGECADMPAVFNALDILTLCSTGEGFPNVVGEAMACGTPCVVTNVGDCTELVGDTGLVVSVDDPHAIAGAWNELVRRGATGRSELGTRARQRIVEHFNRERFLDRTYQALERCVSRLGVRCGTSVG